MSDFTQAQRSFWDGFAVEYERRRESATSLLGATLHRQLRLERAASVLEVGAGAGAGALDLMSHLPVDARLVATDLSPAMLRLAQAKLCKRGSRVDIISAEAQRLPFADASFDRYVCNLTLMLVEKPDDAVAEAARVLRPGGCAGWSVWGRPLHSPLRTLFFDAARALRIELPQPAARRTPFHLGRRERLRHLLEHAGFTSVVTWYSPSIEAVSDGASLAEDIVQTEVAARQMDRRSLRALQKKLAQLADERLASGQPIALDVLMATASKPEQISIQRHAPHRRGT